MPTLKSRSHKANASVSSRNDPGTLPGRERRKAKKDRREPVSQSYWAEEQDEVDSPVSQSQRRHLLEQFGDFSIAYSTAVQPRLEYFGDAEGCLAYRRRWGVTFVLGEPLAPRAKWSPLLDEFLARQPRAMFCQIGHSMATLLADRGYCVNEMGVDTTLDLPEYEFAGKEKEWLRYAANWSRRRDFEIVEASFDQISPDEVEAVSEAWRKTRTVKRKEVRFLNRPIVLQDEPGVRKFFYRDAHGKLLAFVFLDPLFRDGQVVGYVTSIKRRHPDAPIYAEQAIMKTAIETLKKEGAAELKLGLSPLAWIKDDQFKASWLTSRWFSYAFRAPWVNRYFYHLVGHADYKRRFRGREEKVYLATQGRFRPIRLMALVGLCGVA